MNDRPTGLELLEAVRGFLADEVVPALQGHLKYQARVAANVVGIVAREIESEERQLAAEWSRLAELLAERGARPIGRGAQREQIQAWTRTLTDRIRAGEADEGPWREAVVAHLEQTVADKLEVARTAR